MNTTLSITPRLIDVHQVALVYGISERSVWRLCRRGELPAPVNFGGRLTRWRVADLLEHIGNMEAVPRNDADAGPERAFDAYRHDLVERP